MWMVKLRFEQSLGTDGLSSRFTHASLPGGGKMGRVNVKVDQKNKSPVVITIDVLDFDCLRGGISASIEALYNFTHYILTVP